MHVHVRLCAHAHMHAHLLSWRTLAVLKGHTGTVFSVAVTPDGQHVLSGSFDRAVRVWRADTWNAAAILSGHTHSVRAVVVSVNGQYAVSSGCDNVLRIWDTKSWTLRRVFTGHVGNIRKLAAGRSTAPGSSDGSGFVVSASLDRLAYVWPLWPL